MRILLIEDHPDSGVALARLLRLAAHEVRVAANGAEALAACAAGSFDLLISDIGLPDMDGWALLALIREQCDLPAIALTAHGLLQDAERSRAAGFAAHLTKPVDLALLAATIARLTTGGPPIAQP